MVTQLKMVVPRKAKEVFKIHQNALMILPYKLVGYN
jgi:hypothetical protein